MSLSDTRRLAKGKKRALTARKALEPLRRLRITGDRVNIPNMVSFITMEVDFEVKLDGDFVEQLCKEISTGRRR